jgi:uncharacterized 2Fe-2S/4Fe-4S cluster protein (DUF4445 family)
MHTVVFLPDEKSVRVEDGKCLLDVAVANDIFIGGSCGGEGLCGKCKIKIEEGSVPARPSPILTEDEIDKGVRLSCQTRVTGNLRVQILTETRLGDQRVLGRKKTRILRGIDFDSVRKDWTLAPLVEKFYLELKPPTSSSNMNDSERVLRHLRLRHGIDATFDFNALKELAKTLRSKDFHVTTSVLMLGPQPRILKVEKGDTTRRHFSIAIDVGTTSVYGYLLDLNTGMVMGEESDYNAQIAYGDDVITRIIFSQKEDGLKKLQGLIVKTINGLCARLMKVGKIKKTEISYIVFSGNTTMIHLLYGIDPKYIRESPYVPTVLSLPPIDAQSLGLDLPESTLVFSIPCVASFMGGDIVAGILFFGLHKKDETILYIDVGTNGEIVLGSEEAVLSASCSAGPAFEGVTIGDGMRATRGAIEEVRLNPKTFEPMLLTIGHTCPKGICGSGLIDLVAELLEVGLLTPNGKFEPRSETKRIKEINGRREFILCAQQDFPGGREIVLTEPDIDDLMRSKAAVYACISVLLRNAGLSLKDIDKVAISGNFGRFLDIERAITIGLLPDIPRDKFIFIGNGSLMGAALASLSIHAFQEAVEISGKVTNIELTDNPMFMDEYIQALFFPHTHCEEFPTITKRLKSVFGRGG